jgi:hypothetical protein
MYFSLWAHHEHIRERQDAGARMKAKWGNGKRKRAMWVGKELKVTGLNESFMRA